MPPASVTPVRLLTALVAAGIVVAGFTLDRDDSPVGASRPSSTTQSASPFATPSGRHTVAHARVPAPFRRPLLGMPTPTPGDVYAADVPGRMQAGVAHAPAYLYVPNAYGAPVTTVIDQRTRKVVRVLHTGSLSQHVTPSYDMSRLYVEASASDRIAQLDPMTARIVKSYPVDRPYNLYFTPDGQRAIVMDEEHQKINFTDPKTFAVRKKLTDPACTGPNHADFSANGRYFLVSCEFSDVILKVSSTTEKVIGTLHLPSNSKPQDVRLAPDGRSFYVAAMNTSKLLRIGWRHLKVIGSTNMPAMPHGIYPSRNGKYLYVSDRMAGEVSVFSLAQRKLVDTWKTPPGGTPDMGGVSADGNTLWLSGRYTGDVYGWDTRTGKLVADIHVGGNPHGLLVWPQPGRYSLGHTGNLR